MSTLHVENLKGPTSGANANNIIVPSGQTFTAPGVVVAVHNVRSTASTQTINSSSFVNITGLSITITPKNANNILVMDSTIATSFTYVTNYAFLKDGSTTVTSLGSTGSAMSNSQLIQYIPESDTSDNNQIMQVTLQHFETAGNTNSRTYTGACNSKWGSAYSMRVNNRSSNDMSCFSTFRIMEIAQ